MRNLLILVVIAVSIASCATAKRQSDTELSQTDDNTKIGVEESEGGFEIEVFYTRYQFIPESDVVAEACKSVLLASAYDYADEHGKEIERVNEQRIKLSMGRNGMSGITSCSASVIVKWKAEISSESS